MTDTMLITSVCSGINLYYIFIAIFHTMSYTCDLKV
jgi:hypothetical protein